MAYDEALAGRVRAAIGGRPDVSERRMFGGIAFMAGDKMFCGVQGSDLMARVGPDAHDECLAMPGARIMDFTGRPSRGFLYVGSPGIDSDAGLQAWVDRTYAFAASLPPKGGRRRR